MRALVACAAFLALVLAACGPDESGECQCIGEPLPACKAYCAPEDVAEAALPLSVGLTVYTVTAQSAPADATACNAGQGPWFNNLCSCGSDYTDNAARCNTNTETLIVRVPPLGCEAGTATLSYQVSTWAGATTVDVRRILRPVTDPTMGVAGLCASTAMASWYRSGPEAWTLPGGKGDGTDRSVAAVTKSLVSAGARVETFDVHPLVGGCSSGCVLAQFNAGPHASILAGTASLIYTCAGPAAVCGDGAIAGAEACDDGGTVAGDGCSALCAVEPGYACSGAPSSCATTCGDGVKAGAEECDDGAANGSNAPCSASCAAQVCGCSPP